MINNCKLYYTMCPKAIETAHAMHLVFKCLRLKVNGKIQLKNQY